GIRTATIEVTDTNSVTASAQNIIRVFRNGPVAVDDSNTVLANATGTISGNVVSNDSGNGLSVSEVDVYPSKVGTSYETLYGSINIQSNGTYTYDVDETSSSVTGLKSGETLVDIVSYTVKDNADITDYGIISISISGVDEAPTAVDNNDNVTVTVEPNISGNIITDVGDDGVDFVDRGLSTLVWENEFSASGGVFGGLSGPVDGASANVGGVTLDFTSTDISNIGVANQNQVVFQTGTNGGHLGYLLYSIDGSTTSLNDTELIIDFDEPVFNLGFLLVDIDFSQGTSWQDQIKINGSLNGAASAFKFITTGGVVDAGNNTFYGVGNAIQSDATGNINVLFEEPINQLVLSYNYGPNATDADQGGQIAGVSDIYWQGSASNVLIIQIDGNPVTTGSTFVGTYGTLVINPDGSYTYTPDLSNPAVAGLLVGNTLTETFDYRLSDGSNFDNANLIITLNGSKIAPTVSISTIEGDNIVNEIEATDVTISGTTTDVEDGQTVTVTITDGTNTINTTAVVNGGIWTATAVDMSGFKDGTFTATVNVTDVGGNSASNNASFSLNLCGTLDYDNDGIEDVLECTPAKGTILTGDDSLLLTGEYNNGNGVD
ncbi:MAG: VCBS domain-containing protein, partial [Olleya sp.]